MIGPIIRGMILIPDAPVPEDGRAVGETAEDCVPRRNPDSADCGGSTVAVHQQSR